MTEGDTVALRDAPYITGTITKLPNSDGRSRKRCQITTPDGSRWLYLDELIPVGESSEGSEPT